MVFVKHRKIESVTRCDLVIRRSRGMICTFILAPFDKFVIEDTDPALLGVQFINIPGLDLLGREEIVYVITDICHIEDHVFQFFHARLESGKTVVL